MKLWLSQEKVEEEIPVRFNMKGVKLANIPFGFHSKFSSVLCLVYKEENVMSHIPYDNIVGTLDNAMKWHAYSNWY